MKIEVDLNEILTDEYGPTESLAESIHRQVVENITNTINKGIRDSIDDAVNAELTRIVSNEVQPRLGDIMEDILNAEYTPVGRYGQRGEPTTFRKELIATISSECVIKRDNYNRRAENAFTRAVDSIVDDMTNKLRDEFRTEVDAEFMNRAVVLAKETFTKALSGK